MKFQTYLRTKIKTNQADMRHAAWKKWLLEHQMLIQFVTCRHHVGYISPPLPSRHAH